MSICDFILYNQSNILNILAGKPIVDISQKFIAHAKYIEFISGDFEKLIILRRVFLGSIISCYLEESFSENKKYDDVELVLDTNFIVSLLELHSVESNNTCRRLFDIAKKLGFKFTVLDSTVEETKRLLENVSDEIRNLGNSTSELFPYFEREITRQCYTRNITTTMLLQIENGLEQSLKKLGLYPFIKTIKLTPIALKDARYFADIKSGRKKKAVLHDTIAMLYVESVRGRKFKKFEKVTCWFLQDCNKNSYRMFKKDGTIYEKINSH